MAGNNGSNATLDFLRNYAAGGGTVLVQQPNGQYVPQNANNAPTLQSAPPTTPLNQNAGGGAGGSAPANQAAQTRQSRGRDATNRRALRGGLAAVSGHVGDAASGPRKQLQVMSEWAGRVPTPGGIGMLLIILLVFISAIVAVNKGLTRLQLAWLTILNQTYIPESQQATADREQPGANNGSNLVQNIVNSAQNAGTVIGAGVGSLVGNQLGTSGVVAIPANGQLPIAGPMSSTGLRSF